jgi:hypothetical protein
MTQKKKDIENLNFCKSSYYDVPICKDLTRLTSGSYKYVGEVYNLVDLKGVDIITKAEVLFLIIQESFDICVCFFLA